MKKILIITLALFLFACSSKKSGVNFDLSTMPTQTVYDAETMFTDRGQLQMEVKQPVLYNYDDEEKTQISPNGIELTFYDKETNELQVFMRADSAINSQKSRLMRFYKNVEVYDYRTMDTIYTEAMYWDQDKRKIYSDVYVKRLSPKIITEGDGFDADEQMTNIKIRNPRYAF
ncbi:MAG: LPS export ABC transporter periplasmic protein LptC [Bacteroidales bacterium]|nr:LPS export ABC transporter periplasmic protein LptC [Bacteroidales bacterium]